MHGRARRGGDADPVPAQRRVVGTHDAAEVVENVAVHRPVELAIIRRADRARAARGGARPRSSAASLRLDRRDDVVEPALALSDLRETLLGLARVLLDLLQALLPLLLECREPRFFFGFLRPVLAHAALERHEIGALAANLCAQIVDALDQRAVVQRDLVQILVARDELAERIGGEQRLKIVERAALVDLRKAMPQDRSLRDRLVLGANEIRSRLAAPRR